MDMIPLYLDKIGGKADASRSTSLLELAGAMDNWWKDYSFLDLYLPKHPDTDGEIGKVIRVGEGDRTVVDGGGTHDISFLYHMRATSTTPDDFYFDQYRGDTPTGWSYHLTRITK